MAVRAAVLGVEATPSDEGGEAEREGSGSRAHLLRANGPLR